METDYAPIVGTLTDLYPDTLVDCQAEIIDYEIRLVRPRSVRRWVRPYIRFGLEDLFPFDPYPVDHAFPLLEWGLNWSIATSGHHNLMLHSGALERDGHARLLPAVPGSGKSTLVAALAHRRWRLLSDEFGLVGPNTGQILPLPRAVALKNASINVIRQFAPDTHLGPVFPKTRKGDVAHMRPPGESLRRQQEAAEPRWVVFPRYCAGHEPILQPITKSLAFTRLAYNSFNYRLLGATGFRTLAGVIRRCDCYGFEYGNLEGAIATLEQTLFR